MHENSREDHPQLKLTPISLLTAPTTFSDPPDDPSRPWHQNPAGRKNPQSPATLICHLKKSCAYANPPCVTPSFQDAHDASNGVRAGVPCQSPLEPFAKCDSPISPSLPAFGPTLALPSDPTPAIPRLLPLTLAEFSRQSHLANPPARHPPAW